MEATGRDLRWQGRRPQPLLIRLTHWLNVPLLLLMAGSGLQIFAAYPALGPRGALYKPGQQIVYISAELSDCIRLTQVLQYQHSALPWWRSIFAFMRPSCLSRCYMAGTVA